MYDVTHASPMIPDKKLIKLRFEQAAATYEPEPVEFEIELTEQIAVKIAIRVWPVAGRIRRHVTISQDVQF